MKINSTVGEAIGRNLTTKREEKQLSRKEFAEFLGLYPGTYAGIENGNATSISNLCMIADKLDCSLDWLCGRDEA